MKITVSNIVTLLLVLLVYGGIIIFLRGHIPDAKTIIKIISDLYKTYGYSLVFVGGILEGLFLIGNYVPGSAVIFLGSALSRTGQLQFPWVIFFGVVGLNVAYSANYFLGKYGWYHILARFGLEKQILYTEKKLKENTFKAIGIGYFSITTAAFVSTAAGIIRLPFRRFLMLSIVSQLFWSLVWGGVAYFFGLPLIEFVLKYFALAAVAIGIVLMVRYILK